MDLDLLISKYKNLGIELLSELISKESVLDYYRENSNIPFGNGNKEALEKFIEIGQRFGFKTYNYENYFGYIEYGEGSEILGILCHLDVVPVVDDEWVTPPFKLTIKDGKMYGRGTTDDKGPLVSVIVALKALKDEGFIPNLKIRLIAGCDEESGSRCIMKYKDVFESPKLAFSPDACFPLINGEKAILSYDIKGKCDGSILTYAKAGDRYNIVPSVCEFRLNKDLKREFNEYLINKNFKGEIIEDTYKVYGKASHAMVPNEGLNAIYIMFDFLSNYTKDNLVQFINKYYLWDNLGVKAGYNDYDQEMKELTSNLAVIRLENNEFKLGFNVRAPHDSSFDDIPNALNDKLNEYGYNYSFLGGSKRHYVDPNTKLVKKLLKAYNDVTKLEPYAYSIGGGTYAREFPNAVAFGPMQVGAPDVCHISNEYMTIDDFECAIKVYYKAIKELTK